MRKLRIKEFLDGIASIMTDMEMERRLTQKDLMKKVIKRFKASLAVKEKKKFKANINTLLSRLEKLTSKRESAITELNVEVDMLKAVLENQEELT